MIKKDKNTQKEAARKALEILGGRAQMKYICLVAAYLIGDNTQAKNVWNNVRREIYTNSTLFQRVPNMPDDGWWELTSYHDEVDGLKREIEVLKAQLAMKDKTIEELKAIPKEAEFIEKFLKEVMDEYKRKPKLADPIRNILRHMRNKEAAAVLDAWIDEKEEELKRALEKLKIQIHTIAMTGQHAKYIENSNDNDE